MSVCVCVCAHAYSYICRYTYIYLYRYVHIYIYIISECIYIRVHICVLPERGNRYVKRARARMRKREGCNRKQNAHTIKRGTRVSERDIRKDTWSERWNADKQESKH